MEALKKSVFSFIMINIVKKGILHFLVNTDAQLEGGGGGGGGEGWGDLPCAFTKTGKRFPDFGKKCPYCGHLLFKFLIYNEFLKILY